MRRKRTVWRCDWCGEWGNGLSLAASAADYLMHRRGCGLDPADRLYVRGYFEKILPPRIPGRPIDPFDFGALPGGEE